jgi:hypothetical protein
MIGISLGRPGTRATSIASLAVPVAGLALAVGLVWQSSYSAFSSATENPGNSWAAGSVQLADDDAGIAMFDAEGLAPGDTGDQCITVTSTGSVPSTVRLYGSGLTSTNGLASSILLTVEQGSGGTSGGGCTGFTAQPGGSAVYAGTLAGFTAADFASGYGSWAPSGSAPQTRTYKVTYTIDPAAPDAVAGGVAGVAFVWEAQS